MENVLFKISYPAEFHAQTAVEAAVQLHGRIENRVDDIERIVITTHESAIRIISKEGELRNPADRDHCLQYMCAVALLKGDLTALDYEDSAASNPAIDALRAKMVVVEDPEYSAEYLEPTKRSIPNAIEVFFGNGNSTGKLEVRYPVGHRKRRREGIPLLLEKFERNLATRFEGARCEKIVTACSDQSRLEAMPVNEFVDLFIPE
jgi:2-methylcitrate dehydratase